MKLNTTETSHITGALTFSKEERETFQKAYSIIGRVVALTNNLGNFKDNFEGYLNYGKYGTVELFHLHLQEIFDMLEELKNLESVEYEYDKS